MGEALSDEQRERNRVRVAEHRRQRKVESARDCESRAADDPRSFTLELHTRDGYVCTGHRELAEVLVALVEAERA